MFFLYVAKKVGGIADLRFHLLFAIAVVVVSDERYDHTVLISASDLEGLAIVVFFRGIFPAHAIANLQIRRFGDVR